MITQKELKEITIQEQERIVKQKERDYNDVVKKVEQACKEAAYNGLFEIDYRIPSCYGWIIHRLIDKLNEAGLTVKISDTVYDLASSLNISWEATNE